jgi:hypothetical protein
VAARKTWRTSGCYLWRVRKPHAFLGLPLRWCLVAGVMLGVLLHALDAWWWLAFLAPLCSGRHNGYVGQSGNRRRRDGEHIYGSEKYGTKPKPWADLDPKCYPLPCLFPWWQWARERQEWLWIKILLPVYNVLLQNRFNFRQIKPKRAEAQRSARDRTGLKANLGRALARGTVVLLFLAGTGWIGWEQL